ncbi:MAG: aromatic amino acid lyase [Halofilum sp. (in: g-proteobacteria)]|nr:aromatic amino acid lyase [Halofilum sp. (in: g-proteobacteria)]
MTVELESRRDFSLANVERVAWQREDVAFGARARERMSECRSAFLRLLENPDIVVYGVTSGYGQMAGIRLDPAQRRLHASRPPWQSMASFGEPLPERVVRTIVFARLANYVEGHAAISPGLAEAVAGMLAEDELPPVPFEGNGGAGEVLPLSHLFAPLGARHGLEEKDALALINGSPCAAALVADAALVMRRRLDLIEDVFALSFEALRAPLEHIDPALDELWGDEDEAAALAGLRSRLEGSDVRRRSYQAPVSFRILPRMLGRFRRALRQAEEAATRSLQAITDNPVFIAPDAERPDGRVLSNGGYHNTMAWPAMDELGAACADLCTLAERHAAKLLYGPVSHLPDQLREGPMDSRYMGCLAMVQVGFGEAARRAAQRTFIPGSESGGFGQNDVATPGFPAWRGQAEAGRMLDLALAPLAMIASQAMHVTDHQAPPGLSDRLERIRECAPVLTEGGQPLGPEAQRLADRFREEVLARTEG